MIFKSFNCRLDFLYQLDNEINDFLKDKKYKDYFIADKDIKILPRTKSQTYDTVIVFIWLDK